MYSGFMRIRRFHLQYELYQGGMSPVLTRECSGRGGVVAALVHDPKKKVFVFVEQFRIGAMAAGVHPWQIELVAGIMDKDAESIEACVQREIKEELGTEALQLQPLCAYFGSLGGSASRTHVYLATVDAAQCPRFTGVVEEGEDIRVIQYSYEETWKRFLRGEFDNSNTRIALAQLFLEQSLGKQHLDFQALKEDA